VARSLGVVIGGGADEEAAGSPVDELDLVVGRVTRVEGHPNADKLWVMSVDLGEEETRTLVAGLRGHYDAGELEGTDIVVVSNLAPATLRGVRSQGMLLAASWTDDDGTFKVVPLTTSLPAPNGATVS